MERGIGDSRERGIGGSRERGIGGSMEGVEEVVGKW